MRNGAAVQIRDGEPARPWLIHLECTQWLKCSAPAAWRPSLSSLLRTIAASSRRLACLNSAEYHPSHLMLFQWHKDKILGSKYLRFVSCLWTQTHPLSWNLVTVYADNSSLAVTHRLPTYTADALRRNDWKCKCQSSAKSFSAHRLNAHRESKSSRDVWQIGWRRTSFCLSRAFWKSVHGCQSTYSHSLPVEGVHSGAPGRNSLSLNDHDSSLALIKQQRQSSADCTNAELPVANDRHHYIFKASSVSAFTFPNRKWCVTLRRSAR